MGMRLGCTSWICLDGGVVFRLGISIECEVLNIEYRVKRNEEEGSFL